MRNSMVVCRMDACRCATQDVIDLGNMLLTVGKGHEMPQFLGVLTSVLHPPQRFSPRTVVHFSYHAWPDHGVPRTALPLRRLAASARDIPSQGPPIVHCSAGTRCASRPLV